MSKPISRGTDTTALRLEAMRLAVALAPQTFEQEDTHTHGQLTRTKYARDAASVVKDAEKIFAFLKKP